MHVYYFACIFFFPTSSSVTVFPSNNKPFHISLSFSCLHQSYEQCLFISFVGNIATVTRLPWPEGCMLNLSELPHLSPLPLKPTSLPSATTKLAYSYSAASTYQFIQLLTDLQLLTDWNKLRAGRVLM